MYYLYWGNLYVEKIFIALFVIANIYVAFYVSTLSYITIVIIYINEDNNNCDNEDLALDFMLSM